MREQLLDVLRGRTERGLKISITISLALMMLNVLTLLVGPTLWSWVLLFGLAMSVLYDRNMLIRKINPGRGVWLVREPGIQGLSSSKRCFWIGVGKFSTKWGFWGEDGRHYLEFGGCFSLNYSPISMGGARVE